MKKDLTQMVFILDKSGSMSGKEEDTIGGYNSMLKKQKGLEGDALITTVLFNHQIDKIQENVPLEEVAELTSNEYTPSGMTALLDAIGETIHIVEENIKKSGEEAPENVIVVITTDGLENSSREYSLGIIKDLIEKKKKEGWEFLFLGANIDAISTGMNLGIGREYSVKIRNNSAGIRNSYDAISDAVAVFRRAEKISADWKKDIEIDVSSKDDEENN